jgi:hypothetical protein
MSDCGLPPTEVGGISKEQFMEYRAQIEDRQPISSELEHVNLGFLPPRFVICGLFIFN